MSHLRWIGLFALSGIALVPSVVQAQGPAKAPAPAKVKPPAAAADLVKLQVIVQKLSLRVTELEQGRAADLDEVDLMSENMLKMQDVIARMAKSLGTTQQQLDATQKALANTEKSLAAVKAAQAQLKAVGNAKADGARVVRAPFVVVDGDGQSLFRVEQGSTSAGRVVVGNPEGNHIVLGAGMTDDIGVVLYFGGANRISMVANAKTSNVVASVGQAKAWMGAQGNGASGWFGLSSDQGKTLAQLWSRKGGGYLELNNGSGSKMVEAGSLETAKGYVLVNPARVNNDPAGAQSVLLGGGKP